jgi:hypothetical protein
MVEAPHEWVVPKFSHQSMKLGEGIRVRISKVYGVFFTRGKIIDKRNLRKIFPWLKRSKQHVDLGTLKLNVLSTSFPANHIKICLFVLII